MHLKKNIFCHHYLMRSCYGWKWHFLAKKASHEIEKHSQLSKNIWYFIAKRFWKLIIWFCYLWKKKLFFVVGMAHGDPIFAQVGGQKIGVCRYWLWMKVFRFCSWVAFYFKDYTTRTQNFVQKIKFYYFWWLAPENS